MAWSMRRMIPPVEDGSFLRDLQPEGIYSRCSPRCRSIDYLHLMESLKNLILEWSIRVESPGKDTINRIIEAEAVLEFKKASISLGMRERQAEKVGN